MCRGGEMPLYNRSCLIKTTFCNVEKEKSERESEKYNRTKHKDSRGGREGEKRGNEPWPEGCYTYLNW